MFAFQLLILAAVTSSAIGGVVPSENKCPGTFYETRITDCTAYPCILYKGKEYTVEIDFSPFRTSNSSSIKCNTVYMGRAYEIPEEPSCKDITPNGCPLDPETRYKYQYKFTIPQVVPSTYYPIRCALVDETKTEHICIAGSGRIYDSPMSG